MIVQFTSFQALLYPALIAGALLGWRRGTRGQMPITIGLAFAVLLTVVMPAATLAFLSRAVLNIPRALGLLAGRDDVGTLDGGFWFGQPDTPSFLLVRVVLFTLIAYIVITKRTYGAAHGGSDRIVGALLGAGAGAMFFVAVSDFASGWRSTAGTPAPLEGTTVAFPEVSSGAFQSLVPTIIVVIVLGVLIAGIRRLPSLWKR